MPTYISILRGINLGKHNSIKMPELKTHLADLGFKQITTYIQSGNVLYQYKKTSIQKLSQLIAQKIKDQFDYEVPVITLMMDDLQTIIDNNPFAKDTKLDPKYFHVTFLNEAPKEEHINILQRYQYPPDACVVKNNAAYVYTPGGYGATKFSNKFLENKLKVAATTRNWKTTLELIKMAQEIAIIN